MNRLTNTLKWDLVMLWKYGLFYAGLVVALIWTGILLFIPVGILSVALPILLFSDIATTGFFFIAVLTFFEKSQGSIYAVAVTPLTAREYLLSKVLALTLFGFGVAMLITGTVAAIQPVPLNWSLLIIGVLLLVIFNILLEFRVVVPYANFTDYLSVSLFYLIILT